MNYGSWLAIIRGPLEIRNYCKNKQIIFLLFLPSNIGKQIINKFKTIPFIQNFIQIHPILSYMEHDNNALNDNWHIYGPKVFL